MRTLDDCRGLPDLADHVWAQRSLAQRLHYRLVVAALVLASDEREMVAQALAEVDEAAAELGRGEVARVQAAAEVALDWGVPTGEVTLSLLAEQSPDPWGAIFAEHRDAFADLTDQISRAVAENRRLATSALDGVRQVLGAVDRPSAEGYTAAGRAAAGSSGPLRLDRSV